MNAPAIVLHEEGLTLEIRFEREAMPFWPGTSRFYEMRVQRSAQLTFDGQPSGFDLVIKKGSLKGKRSTCRVENFASLTSAIARFGHFANERRERGYKEVPITTKETK